MRILLALCFFVLCSFQYPWGEEYQQVLLSKVGEKIPELASYPSFMYPNTGHEKVVNCSKNGKVLLFGYGSLMSKASAGRSVGQSAVETMRPVVAFGVKRIFNYKAKNTSHWGLEQDQKEKAMLNLAPSLNSGQIINGVVLEIDKEDFLKLVARETGYDVVPILVAPWDEVMQGNPNVELQVAYTFIASSELREHTLYIATEFYPVRGYLQAVREASLEFGEEFYKLFEATTFLANGTTTVGEWDESFSAILCTKRP